VVKLRGQTAYDNTFGVCYANIVKPLEEKRIEVARDVEQVIEGQDTIYLQNGCSMGLEWVLNCMKLTWIGETSWVTQVIMSAQT
jgi:hypothetical protein